MCAVWELSRQFLKDYSVSSGTRFLNCLAVQSLHSPRYSLDWKDISASEISERVLKRVQPGSIVLFHNAALHTPEALPAILTCLINDGYTVLPISQLILPPALHHRPHRPTVSGGAGYILSRIINYVNPKHACLYTFRRASSSFM